MRASRRLIVLAVLGVGLLAPSPSSAVQGDGDVAHDAGLQWGLATVRAQDAWATGTGRGVTIAVVDSGVALEHEDLSDHIVEGVACRNTDGDPNRCEGSPSDHDGHGTHVAGIAAAVTGNGVGVAGTAPDASLMPIKVLFSPCEGCPSAGNASDVIAAIRWATDHGADVINLSLGSTTSSVFGPGFADALQAAWDAGVIPVVAAGNELVLTSEIGAGPAVIVSATDRDDRAPPYSHGVGSATWAIAAPGGDGDDTPESCAQEGDPRGILSTYWADDDEVGAYACLSGTSMAAPFVSGALAILLGTGLEPQAAVEALLAGAVDVGDPGPDDVFGAGRLDIMRSLEHADLRDPGDDGVISGAGSGDDDEPGPGSAARSRLDDSADRPAAAVAIATLLILATSLSTAVLAGRASLEKRRADLRRHPNSI